MIMLFLVVAILFVDLWTISKIGLNNYSGKLLAVSFTIITVILYLVLEEKTKEDKIFLSIITALAIIFSLKYLSLLFAIPIAIVLAVLLFYHVYKDLRLSKIMLLLPVLISSVYLVSFLTKPIVLTGTTGYAIIHQSLLPRATILSIKKNTVTFQQTRYIEIEKNTGKVYQSPKATDCVLNTANGNVFCFSFVGEKNNEYFIQGQIFTSSGEQTCYIILYPNNTYKSNCPYVQKVTYIGLSKNFFSWPSGTTVYTYSLKYSITFNESNFAKLLNYNLNVVNCKSFANGTCLIKQIKVTLNTWGSKEYYIHSFYITYDNKVIYKLNLKNTMTHYWSKTINVNAFGKSRVICMNVELTPWHVTKKPIFLNICEPLPVSCINYSYLEMISKKLHTYFTPYQIQAKINISKIKLPYAYVNITFNKQSYGKKVGLVVYNNNKSSPTLQENLTGSCKGNTCYKVVKIPLPAVNKTNNIKLQLIGGPNSKIISQAHMSYNPIKKIMKAKNMTTTEKKKMIQQTMSKIQHMQRTYRPMYHNKAPPLEKEEQQTNMVSRGCKILLGISIVFMIGMMFLV